MLIRAASLDDWPAIWPFMEQIVRAGETFSWDRDISQPQARAIWFPGASTPQGHTVVATDAAGAVLGTAQTGPNHGGPGSHIATASFMVDPAHSGSARNMFRPRGGGPARRWRRSGSRRARAASRPR